MFGVLSAVFPISAPSQRLATNFLCVFHLISSCHVLALLRTCKTFLKQACFGTLCGAFRSSACLLYSFQA